MITRAALPLLTAAILAVALSPSPSMAETCTDAYEGCIDAGSSKGFLIRDLAYIECFADWVGCVGSHLKFW